MKMIIECTTPMDMELAYETLGTLLGKKKPDRVDSPPLPASETYAHIPRWPDFQSSFTTRTYNCLHHGLGISTWKELTNSTGAEILKGPNIGHGTMREIHAVLRAIGLTLKKE